MPSLLLSPAERAITDAGFQFLLRDSHRQLWVFLARYISQAALSSKGWWAPGHAILAGVSGDIKHRWLCCVE